jgi:hypothetical protein
MEDSNSNTVHPHPEGTSSPHAKRFQVAISMLAVMVTGGIFFQLLRDWIHLQGLPIGSPVIAAVAFFAIVGLALYKPFYRQIDTPPFAISSLLAIAFATALGTFVTQLATPEVLTQRYGETGSKILQFLQLDDVFHSWWYVGFFILLSVSLIKISLRKAWGLKNLGFHLAHLSPIVILLGFWLDYFHGFQGIIQLEEGQSKNQVMLWDAQRKNIADTTQLDFSLRLDNFEFERHDPDYRIQVWRQDTSHAQHAHAEGGMDEQQPEIVASMEPEAMKIRHIYGTDLYFRVTKLFPNFEFKYSYPANIDTIEAKDPGIQMDVQAGDVSALLQLRSEKSGKHKIMDMSAFGGWIEFYWDLPKEVSTVLSQPAQADANRIIFAGKDRRVHFLFEEKVTSAPLELNRYYPVPGKDSTGFTVKFLFPNAAYLSAEPSTKDDQMLNPVAMMEIWHKGQPAQNAYLYPSMAGKRPGTFPIPGSAYFLALESIKDQETKYYKSDLSVLSASGDVVRQQAIKVNQPMLYSGYRFYQTDYDPQNPKYSGIGVTYDPGLYVVYLGFTLLVLGVGLMFYWKRRDEG